MGHLTRISARVVARLPVRELAVDDKPIPRRMFAPKSDKDQGLMKARECNHYGWIGVRTQHLIYEVKWNFH